ncbi:uncharacterized protein A4U43_C06F5890 [Asparagus officinalis]|uniref:DFDF domain-containing protein n=1 Tax=Asparagus officinalis TaxID=4686 RepID=A0A5P1EJY5_ASPOF|nr:uncharacterized protein A4U43_C06F5890 [Asparagus officinalis]
MAAETSRSAAPSADSYIGSLISLTSKCEIRYEGILYNINTEESSIGLRNVRSFGTEGRKKDGAQIPASDKIYEYILFRGSDIKDLQVKSSPPPVQTASIHNDPAIIQSHYSHPASTLATLPSAGNGVVAAPSSNTTQLGLSRSAFQGGLPLHRPGGSIGSWGPTPTPPPANGSGLAVPMYWQGYYAPSGGLPHLQQSSLLQPPPGLPIQQSIQQPLLYPGINASQQSGSLNPSEVPQPLFPPVSITQSLTSSMPLTSTVALNQASFLAPETTSTLMPKIPPATTLGSNLPLVPPLTSSSDSLIASSQNMPFTISSKPMMIPASALGYQTKSQPMPSLVGASSSNTVEPAVPLVTPDQLLEPGTSTTPSSPPLQTNNKLVDVKAQETMKKPSVPASSVHAQAKVREPIPAVSESSSHVPAKVKEPILPLPKPMHHKPNGAFMHTHHYNGRRGRGSGRGRGRENGYSRPITKFTEEFDFMAMNEKFNKDEVWGHLGKSKSMLHDREGGENGDESDDNLEDDDVETHQSEMKPVYVKDDFFDTLSSSTLDRNSQGGRRKFSEQLKLDTETFGDFPRHRSNRGGGHGFRGAHTLRGGGGRTRGAYHGREYGYVPRGRGQAVSNRAS